MAGEQPLLSWVMAYASGRGWQLQVAQTGERSSVLAWHHGELMLGYWEGQTLPALAHAFIEEAFAAAPYNSLNATRCCTDNGRAKMPIPGELSVAALAWVKIRYVRR